MIQFLHPAALWTLAALALPLAIHLRRPPPRTVRLGSLRFLENVPRRPWRNPRWRELLLLCVRLGLLAALALLLAEPRWTDAPPSGPRRWALLDPTAMLTGDALARWRSARASGFEPHLLAPGFPAASGEPASGSFDVAAPDLWSLLREADAELPAGSTLAVFSPARLASLRGVRPSLAHCKVEWFQTPDVTGDDPHAWIVSAPAKSDTWHPQAVVGRSDARATIFLTGELRDPVTFPVNGGEKWKIEFEQGRNPNAFSARVLGREDHAADRPGAWTPSAPAPAAVSVLILHDAEHAADARYVEAAVRAAADSAGRPVNVQTRPITADAENAAATNWTFWLSARPVPEGLAARAPRIVRYGGGDAVTVDSRIVAPPGDAAGGIPLRKRTIPDGQRVAGTVWWSDGQGNPLLTWSPATGGEAWELYTRFDPDWTDLTRTTALPAWVRARLFPETVALSATDPFNDRRLADAFQGQSSETGVAVAIPTLAPSDPSSRDLRWPCWIVAALLFLVERTLSLRRWPAPTTISAPRPAPVAVASR